MAKPTPEELRTSIVADSEQLNADDLIVGPITVKITGVFITGDAKQPIAVELEGHKPFKPCKTMRRILIATYTDEGEKWIGERMTLYRDPAVVYGGKTVGGVRISHLSGLTKPDTYNLASSRTKKQDITILPLPDDKPATLSAEDREFIAAATLEIEEADDAALRGYGKMLKGKSPAIQDALRPLYGKRQEQLKAAEGGA